MIKYYIAAKEWLLLDPNENKLDRMDETPWFKRRRFLIEKCKDANVIGILVCKLSGEQTKHIISRMQQLCKVNQKKNYIVSVGKPNVAKLANFPEVKLFAYYYETTRHPAIPVLTSFFLFPWKFAKPSACIIRIFSVFLYKI